MSWLVGVGGLLGIILGALGTYTNYVRHDANDLSDSRHAQQHATEFETSVDDRLKLLVARLDEINRDRDARTAVNNARVDGLAQVLHARIDDANRREDIRNEERKDGMNSLAGRVAALEIKLCVLAGVRIAGCK